MTSLRLLALGSVLLLAALQWGCASQPKASGAPSARTIVDGPGGAARSARGNPPFYEVLGKRYYVLDTSVGYSERGTASWYGRDFHKLPTSSGEPYDMYGMTAAHKTLPLPSWVEVTNLENGKSVIVRVNDRGPFVGDRIIDLSYGAAQALDMIRNGTARVEVRALGTPPAEITAAAAEQPPASGRRSRRFALISAAEADTIRPEERLPQQMFIQVGAFSAHDNARKLVDKLRDGGFENAFIVSSDEPADGLHRVRLGPLRDVAEYDRVNDGLRRLGVGDGRLVVTP